MAKNKGQVFFLEKSHRYVANEVIQWQDTKSKRLRYCESETSRIKDGKKCES